MSAWIVSHNHIAAIVDAAIREEKIKPDEANRTGQALWDTNVESVNCRYPNDQEGPRVYVHRPYPVSDAQLQKLIDCYAYQSCEHDGWLGCASQKFVYGLTAYNDGENLPGYDAAEGGID